MRAAVLAVVVLGLLGAAPAHAQRATAMTAEVKAHWDLGIAYHAARRYAEASAEFAACYRLDPRRECLFAWAQAARLGGDCAAAIPLYEQYARADVSAVQVEAARRQIAACADALAKPAPVVTPPPPPVAPAIAQAAPARLAAPPWYTDRWGDALAGAGIAALATGAIVFVSAGRAPPADAPTYDRYAAQLADARRARTAAIVLTGAGASLIAAGILHFALRDDGHPAAPPLVVRLDATGIELGWAGAF